jgi:two-component system LytT family sensor kinase
MNKRSLYWLCQIGGWLFYILLNSIFLDWNSRFNSNAAFNLFLVFFFGVIYSHAYRGIIVKFKWLDLKTAAVIPIVLGAALFLASLLYFTQLGAESMLLGDFTAFRDPDTKAMLNNILTLSFVFFSWSLVYFLIHFIQNYKKAEFANLQWQASINEIELNKLKSQLNPHFIFNSMNSIRALVDEDPVKAKEAITQLSGILRSTLLMGKKKVISFDEELAIVKDYLSLEATRLEERLKLKIDIGPGSENFQVPPLMLQTLVENGIKHGISQLTAGGTIHMKTAVHNDRLTIQIRNSGQYVNGVKRSSTGLGLENTRQRLKLIYGDKASFRIMTENDTFVLTEIEIPHLR